ncbi:MAG: putative spermidine/putrescine transport system permease protein [Rhodospirillaceae bacterium]|jgi:ABC-type spermidine/putrescine transport system permease subunit II|nr:putative spermidine/putrescine transport system permease protein [Rhodospirillaceae bacterium]
MRMLHSIAVAFIVVFIAIPIVVTGVVSFTDSSFMRFPIHSWSLRWYQAFLSDDQWLRALGNSLEVAVWVMVLSTVMGVTGAYGYVRHSIPNKGAYYAAVTMSLYMPGTVLGLGVAIFFGSTTIFGYQLYGSQTLLVLAHCLWAMPLSFMIMEAAYRSVDFRIVEASYDLGAGPLRTFCVVTVPMVMAGVISSAIFSFVISLNEIVMAIFLTTRETQTLPVLMWLSLRNAGTPILAVAANVLAAVVFVSLFAIMMGYMRHLRRLA